MRAAKPAVMSANAILQVWCMNCEASEDFAYDDQQEEIRRLKGAGWRMVRDWPTIETTRRASLPALCPRHRDADNPYGGDK